MSKEDQFLQSYLTGQYNSMPHMTQEEFTIAMIGLMEKGLMEVVEKDGSRFYRPTFLLQQMKKQFNSNPKTQN